MKVAAILMVIVLVASIGGVGYLYLTANVTVVAVGVTATEATAQQAAFEQYRDALAAGSATGTIFQTDAKLGDAENYQFFTYTVRLRNNSMLLCDMVEMQVTPRDGDVLQSPGNRSLVLAARSTGDISATVLSDIKSNGVREVILTYYVWGIPFTVKTTCS